uniref:TKL/TKL-ccin protein kinase n=1 Tax=Mycena chlorophos TaxID=658473 RepID=A0ABQ0M635_MYCCL|nr:TKL/TKL-ccin protein kinase [Mycena chlorophos]
MTVAYIERLGTLRARQYAKRPEILLRAVGCPMLAKNSQPSARCPRRRELNKKQQQPQLHLFFGSIRVQTHSDPKDRPLHEQALRRPCRKPNGTDPWPWLEADSGTFTAANIADVPLRSRGCSCTRKTRRRRCATSPRNFIKRRYSGRTSTIPIYILPFMGLYCDERIGADRPLQSLFLPCPWMKNGTVCKYIESNPDVAIERLMRFFVCGSGMLLSAFHQLLEVVQGVEHLHDQMIVHGDLRGDNILVDDGGHVLLAMSIRRARALPGEEARDGWRRNCSSRNLGRSSGGPSSRMCLRLRACVTSCTMVPKRCSSILSMRHRSPRCDPRHTGPPESLLAMRTRTTTACAGNRSPAGGHPPETGPAPAMCRHVMIQMGAGVSAASFAELELVVDPGAEYVSDAVQGASLNLSAGLMNNVATRNSTSSFGLFALSHCVAIGRGQPVDQLAQPAQVCV